MELVLTLVISGIILRRIAQWNWVPDIKIKTCISMIHIVEEMTPANYPLMSTHTPTHKQTEKH